MLPACPSWACLCFSLPPHLWSLITVRGSVTEVSVSIMDLGGCGGFMEFLYLLQQTLARSWKSCGPCSHVLWSTCSRRLRSVSCQPAVCPVTLLVLACQTSSSQGRLLYVLPNCSHFILEGFNESGDPSCMIMQSWARVEVSIFTDLPCPPLKALVKCFVWHSWKWGCGLGGEGLVFTWHTVLDLFSC